MDKINHYGDDGTYHRTTKINIEVDKTGKVRGVWFRCLPLSFTETIVDDWRAEALISMYGKNPEIKICAIDFVREE